jgi:hypothetical protein
LRLEIVAPLETVRLVLEDNEFGVRVDLTCHTTNVPYMGPVEVRRVDGRLLSERATYEITGPCTGWVDVAGERIGLAPDTSSFFRNHSWGFQPGRGGPRPYGAPVPRRRVPGLRQWVLFQLPGGARSSAATEQCRSSASSTSWSSTPGTGGCGGARSG